MDQIFSVFKSLIAETRAVLFVSGVFFSPHLPETLNELLKRGEDGARWDSRLHQHHYRDDQTQKQVHHVIDALIEDPVLFDKQIGQMSLDERSKIAFDSIDSRTDLIDLLSIELKLRLQSFIDEHFKTNRGKPYPLDSSEVWSLAKYRLKSVLLPETELASMGMMVFRAPGLENARLLAICADSRGSALEGSKALSSQKMAGITIFEIDVKGASTYWTCGSKKVLLSSRTSIPPQSNSQTNPTFEWKDPQHLRFVASIALTATVPRLTQELVSLYIRARGGYEFRSKENVDLHEALSKSISQADLLFLTVNLPDGNHFELSNKARMGQRLSFQRRTASRTIDFDVLLPPIRSSTPSKSQENETGVKFSFREMADLIRSRSGPLQLVDLTCFSQKHIKDWLSAADESHHPSLIIGSERGQQAEGALDVFPQVDLMLNVMNLLADDRQNEALQTLKEGVGFFRMIERWTGLKSSFEPISSNDELYSKWKSRSPRATVTMTDLKDKSRSWRFNPIPEIID